MPPEPIDTTIQEVYAALADDRARNELILADLLRAVETGAHRCFSPAGPIT